MMWKHHSSPSKFFRRIKSVDKTIATLATRSQAHSAIARSLTIAQIAVVMSLCCESVNAFEDWPHWRGTRRNGTSTEMSGWRDGQWNINQVWDAQFGVGSSSPIVIENSVYSMGWRDGDEVVECRDLTNGDILWAQSYEAPQYGRQSVGDQSLYIGPCATPSYDTETDYLYTLGIDGELACWDASSNGEVVWQLNLHDEFTIQRRPDVGGRRGGASRRDYGYTTSPFLHGDLIIVEVAAQECLLAAFDKDSGEIVWCSTYRQEGGHAGGLAPLETDRGMCLCVFALRHLVVIGIEGEQAGETLDQVDWTTDFAQNIPTPEVRGESIIVTSAYNQSSMARYDLIDGELVEKWKVENPSGVCSPVLFQDRIYWAWHGMHGVNFENGETIWLEGRVGDAGSCLITADQKMIVYCNRGELRLYELDVAEDDPPVQLDSRPAAFRRDAWPHVVLANGHLLIRDRDGNFQCYRVD